MNKETTSKETNTSSLVSDYDEMNLTKSTEFFTVASKQPTKGDKRSARCFNREYVREFMKETIGCNGVPGLWILGRPYRGVARISV